MIQLLTLTEIEQYAEVLKTIYRQAFHYSEEAAAFLLQRIKNSDNAGLHTTVLAYIENDTVLGFVFGFDFHPENWWAQQIQNRLPVDRDWYSHTFELNELAVLPSHQRKGIGRQLMEALIHSLSHTIILLGTAQTNNEHIISLYQSLGFENVIEDFRYQNEEYGVSIIMKYEKKS